MLQRALARDGVDEKPRVGLAASGIRSYRQLVQRPLWDVAHAADVSVDEMTRMISQVSMRLAPKPRSAFDMFMESVNRPMTLRTGLPHVDSAVCGGLHCGALHEFAGSSAIGKTQLAMTMAVRCALDYPKHSVMYFDTERGFSARRVKQIARARLRPRYSDADDVALDEHVTDVLKRIYVHHTDTLVAFLNCMKELEQSVPAHQVKLIVVDSVAAPLVKAHNLTYSQREHHMMRIAQRLKYISDVYQVFLVVTNRASTVDSEFGSFTKPALGETWAHCVTSRFVMERHVAYRAITVVKCPSSGPVVQPFELTELGVEAAEEPMRRHEDDDDDDFSIHDDVLRDLDLTGLPTVDPSGTLRSTQQSERDDDEQVKQEAEELSPPVRTAELASDDFVSDSNDESDGGW